MLFAHTSDLRYRLFHAKSSVPGSFRGSRRGEQDLHCKPLHSNTTAVFQDGQLLNPSYSDGWVETNPSIGQVTLDVAPLTGSTIQIFYLDTSPVRPGSEVTYIQASIQDATEDIHGVLLPIYDLYGRIENE